MGRERHDGNRNQGGFTPLESGEALFASERRVKRVLAVQLHDSVVDLREQEACSIAAKVLLFATTQEPTGRAKG